MADVVLTGLDGMTPMGYMAALGVLRIVDEAGLRSALRWELRDAWRPILTLDTDEQGLLDTLVKDCEEWREHPALNLSYEKGGKTRYDLKPQPPAFQEFAHRAAMVALQGDRRWADHVAAYAAAHEGLAVDNSGATKPTALHFTAGNQHFLKAVRQIRDELSRDDLSEAVLGPWRYSSSLPMLGWDLIGGERDYALRAVDPSGEKKLGVPGADWLAFRGLPFFPVVIRGGRAFTAGCEGRGKRYSFSWALWSCAIPASVVGNLTGGCVQTSTAERTRQGVVLSVRSEIRRTDQGGYGSFAAPAVLQ